VTESIPDLEERLARLAARPVRAGSDEPAAHPPNPRKVEARARIVESVAGRSRPI
jgi:hypothetical protein